MSIPEIINHLSNEINNKYTNTIIFRTRIAFVVWVGPFIILSSFIVATKGSLSINLNDSLTRICLGIFLLCYIVLGFIGARIEKQAWSKCDTYRDIIFKIGKQNSLEGISEEDYRDNVSRYLVPVYIIACLLIAISFMAITVLTTHLKTGGDNINDGKMEVRIQEPVKVELLSKDIINKK